MVNCCVAAAAINRGLEQALFPHQRQERLGPLLAADRPQARSAAAAHDHRVNCRHLSSLFAEGIAQAPPLGAKYYGFALAAEEVLPPAIARRHRIAESINRRIEANPLNHQRANQRVGCRVRTGMAHAAIGSAAIHTHCEDDRCR